VPGASTENPETQDYRLSGGSATPVTFTVRSQVSAGADPSTQPKVLGFTTSDQVLVLSGGALWEVSPNGSTAQQFAASTAVAGNFAGRGSSTR